MPQGRTIPANIEALFPVWNDVSTWNLAALSPIVRRYQYGTGQFQNSLPDTTRPRGLQDDWQITSRLTLNLGLRYDLALNVFANDVILPPFITGPRPNDTNNFEPRFGFAYTLTDRTVLRGGYGRYFGDLITGPACQMNALANTVVVDIPNDGRPDFRREPVQRAVADL